MDGGGPRERERRPEGLSGRQLQGAASPGLFTDKHETKAAIGAAGTVTVNALGPQFHAGLSRAATAGPDAFPAASTCRRDADRSRTKGFTTLADAAAKFEAMGMRRTRRSSAIAAAASRPPSTSS
jgi:thiosulfate/3-mercaptopyruvate sulfurtransferase